MKTRIPTLIVILATVLLLTACGGAIDASKARSRGLINRGAIVPAEEVRVAEYLNYYEQRFPEPEGQPLGMDLRLGNPRVPIQGGDVWLQVGLQAARPPEGQRTPLNLALVLDTSGSMGETGKMSYLKQSVAHFLHSLRPDDIVAIIAYNDQAEVIVPARPVGDGAWIEEAVDRLRPRGWTNLHAGLMLGFQEVERNFDIRRNNRVILLTDGIANRGITDPARIAADARTYNDRGIYLSTIGLGVSLDDQLLSTLARQGHGAYHYIDSWEEMDRVFREEAEGLVEKVARDITLTLRPVTGELTYLVGYEGTPPARGASIPLPDMGAGESQVVLARFHVPALAAPAPLVDVELTYTDVFGNRQRREAESVLIYPGGADEDPLADLEVRRNVTIVQSALALRRIDELVDRGDYAQALDLARFIEEQLREMAARTGDDQMVEDADLFRRYQTTLAEALGEQAPPTPDLLNLSTPTQPQRWGVPTPPPLPTVEVE